MQVLGCLRECCPGLPEASWVPLGPRLFERLRRHGAEAGFTVYDRWTTGEYLWDVAWVYEPKTEDAYWLELAGEIELADMSFESVIDDLYKVLDAKARLKLFVVAGTQALIRRLRDEIDWAVAAQRLVFPEEQLRAVLLSYSGRTDRYQVDVGVLDCYRRSGGWTQESIRPSRRVTRHAREDHRMTEPRFKTREEYEAWKAKQMAGATEQSTAIDGAAVTSAPGGLKEYKVLTQKDRFFAGKFDPDQLERALNSYAELGWSVVSVATANIPSLTGTREELVVIMERAR